MGLKDWVQKVTGKIKGEKKVIEGEATKDKTYSSENEFPNRQDAEREYKRAVAKLFNINQWTEMPGINSTFTMYNNDGTKKATGKPKLQDFMKILLPGPSPENWVIVTDIKENDKSAEFTVSPSKDPTEIKEDQDKIKHFFIKEATSTFKVELRGNTIYGYEIGRNEGINNEQDAGQRKLINTLISEGGWAGVQKLQWKKLTDYLVHKL